MSEPAVMNSRSPNTSSCQWLNHSTRLKWYRPSRLNSGPMSESACSLTPRSVSQPSSE